MHRGSLYMATKCNLCHTGSGYSNVYMGSSNGTSLNPRTRLQRLPRPRLRRFGGSQRSGTPQASCLSGRECLRRLPYQRPDSAGENVKPTYYGTTDTKCNDPCNAAPGFKENWSVGDTVGLDNDGDLLYDGAESRLPTLPCRRPHGRLSGQRRGTSRFCLAPGAAPVPPT
jgi:hypothetical protein